MSRIGKLPINIPDKVDVKIAANEITVKGPKGQRQVAYVPQVKVEQKDKQLIVTPLKKDQKGRELWGLTRTLINNMVVGVTEGFVKKLEFNGVGYRAAVKGKTLSLNLGYSHPIDYSLPEGVEAKVVKNVIEVSGCDKELVGFVSAKIRSFRPPEPYKGKGVKYLDETILRKAGKSGVKK